MKRVLILLSMVCINLFSMTEEEMQKALDAEASLELGTEYVGSSKEKKKATETSSVEMNSDTYYDYAVYRQLTQERQLISSTANSGGAKKEFLAKNEEAYKKAIEEQKAEARKKEIVDPDEIISLSGFCSVRNEIDVETIQGYGLLDCQFEDNEIGLSSSTVFASFVPVPDKYALIAKPIYLQNSQRKAQIDNGVILTIDQTSLNVANLVNDRKIKELLADVAIESNKYILSSATDYMRQKEASQTEEGVAYNTNDGGNQVITTKNTQAPEASDYLMNFGIQLTSAIIGAIGSMAKEDSYPLFKVYKHSQLYIDVTLKKAKVQSMIDYQNKDLVVKKNTNDSKLKLDLSNFDK